MLCSLPRAEPRTRRKVAARFPDCRRPALSGPPYAGPERPRATTALYTAPRMDLNALKIFRAVAQERSFSRAAAKVHRTQPAVSQAVRRLEVDLGGQLFDRSSKNGTLTEAGRMLQNYGHRLIRMAEETEHA